MSVGLLLLRLVVGAIFIGHGTQKLFGWFGGRGPEGTEATVDSLGYRHPHKMARLLGGAEAGAGALLVLGLFTPLAAAAILGVMINAIVAVHWKNGFWNADGGYEYLLVLATSAVLFGFAGPGAVALDTAFGIFAGAGWGLVTITLGAAGAVAVLFMREEDEPAAAEADAEEEQAREAA
jgi:putative oxidoreductase